MKNLDKFRETIIECATTTEMKADACQFIRSNVLSHFGKEGCDGISCDWCPVLFMLWLDEEYEEHRED